MGADAVTDVVEETYDVIVVGSGIGGLTTAALLTKLAGKRVAVLESHFKLGGFTHTFTRKGWHWDVGIHYLGQLYEGGTSRGLMDLVTGGRTKWTQMPDVFDVFHYPEHVVRVPSSQTAYKEELLGHFPGNEEVLDRYFRDVRRAADWYGKETFRWSAPAAIGAGLTLVNARDRRLGLMTTADYLRRNVPDPQLRAVLTSQWGDYGLPPEQSAFAMHAMVVAHYLRGGYFPAGSSKTIADGAADVIAAGGGTCLVNHRVTRVLVEDGRAVGVEVAVKKGRTPTTRVLRAPLVVSDTGALVTADRLVPKGTAPRLEAAAATATPSITTVTLYLGLKSTPEALGFRGENHWYFEGYDHDVLRARWDQTLEGRPPGGFLSFPSLKDPEATRHTAEVIAFVEYSAFEPWAGKPWLRRGADYEALKDRISEGLLDLVERHHPGFRDLVAYAELSTPLTVEEFTGHPAGQIYGLPATPERIRRRLVPVQTGLPGLLLTGADVCSPGVMGALMGGVFTTASVLGAKGFPLIMGAARKEARRG